MSSVLENNDPTKWRIHNNEKLHVYQNRILPPYQINFIKTKLVCALNFGIKMSISTNIIKIKNFDQRNNFSF